MTTLTPISKRGHNKTYRYNKKNYYVGATEYSRIVNTYRNTIDMVHKLNKAIVESSPELPDIKARTLNINRMAKELFHNETEYEKLAKLFEELTTLQYDIGFRTNIKVDSLTKFISGFLWQAQTGDIIDLSITTKETISNSPTETGNWATDILENNRRVGGKKTKKQKKRKSEFKPKAKKRKRKKKNRKKEKRKKIN